MVKKSGYEFFLKKQGLLTRRKQEQEQYLLWYQQRSSIPEPQEPQEQCGSSGRSCCEASILCQVKVFILSARGEQD